MFSFNLLTIFSSIVNLLALAWIIKRYFLGAIIRIMNERREKIELAMKEAEKKLQEAEELRKQRESQLAQARDEAAKIVNEAIVTAEKMKRDITAKAEEEAEKIIVKAHEISMAERKRVLETAKKEVLSLSRLIIKEFFRRFLPVEAEELLINQFVDSLNLLIVNVKGDNIEEIRFVSPDNVSGQIKKKIEDKLRSLLPGSWKLNFELDPSIGLGFKLFIGEFLIDNSLDYHLSQIYDSIREVENI
ncbi:MULTISPECIES: F0F1 ATP synthase subunit B [Dictyoglomus]|uniref:ATP synthase subunit b n=1 Tax=Dictyoglomus turgidum (strain DSM 6724 / Z-1310) TaxID=515635 RepID=B8DYT3_DICTD|nr:MULTISPECIES: F0F1 ATP synthase subunit B [Dictyoglomus]ACK41465.1 ATP synthase F0, B subunit [Dictyoglomus turgidum DSM 6724]HBU31854.1 ATP synthase F0 subunit B [Dictyoglomus sp.]